MSEIKREVKTFQVDYACEAEFCDGLMIDMSTRRIVPTFGAVDLREGNREHQCDYCGKRMTLDRAYPYTETEVIETRHWLKGD